MWVSDLAVVVMSMPLVNVVRGELCSPAAEVPKEEEKEKEDRSAGDPESGTATKPTTIGRIVILVPVFARSGTSQQLTAPPRQNHCFR